MIEINSPDSARCRARTAHPREPPRRNRAGVESRDRAPGEKQVWALIS